MRKLSQVSHYPGEMAIRIDCNQLGRKSISQTQADLIMSHLRSPFVLFGSHFVGSISAAQLRTCNTLGVTLHCFAKHRMSIMVMCICV